MVAGLRHQASQCLAGQLGIAIGTESRETSLTPHELNRIEMLLARISRTTPWEFRQEPDGRLAVGIDVGDGTQKMLLVDRDREPADSADVLFIASAPSDLALLVNALRSQLRPPEGAIAAIQARTSAASPAPWHLFLESAGGLAGPSIIQTPGDERDMYLTVEGQDAADEYWIFIADARSAIAELLKAIDGGSET